MTHVEIAARDGMKAGYKARKRVLKRSGLVTAQAALRESFADYCAKVGPDVTALQASMRNKPKDANIIGLAAEIRAAEQRLQELQRLAEAEVVEAPAPARKTASATKENRWNEWAVRKHGIPTKIGATFTYKGKRRTTTFKVTRVEDGAVFTKRVA